MTKLELDNEQYIAVERMANEPTKAALNGSLMGAGKTLMTVELAKRLKAQTILVIGPLGTRVSWFETAQGQDAVTESQCFWINGKKAGKEALENYLKRTPGWYFVGREYYRRIATEINSRTVDLAVVDEIQTFANRKSKGGRLLGQLKGRYKLALSGTPAGNRFEGMWNISRWLWHDKTDRSFWRWVARWCAVSYDPWTPTHQKITGEKSKGEYVKALPCYIRIVPDKKNKIVKDELVVELSASQRKLYKQMEEMSIAWLKDNPLIAEIPPVQRIRLRQITLGEPIVSMTTTTNEAGIEEQKMSVDFDDECKSSKLDALKDYLESVTVENESEPVLIYTDSQRFARVAVKRIIKWGYTAKEWSGAVPSTSRERIKAAFLTGKVQVIVAVPAAIAEGVDGLQSVCNHLVWLSYTENNMINQQALSRLDRRGQDKPVYVTNIVAQHTLDRGQLSNLLEQQLAMNASLRKEASAA